MPNEIYHRSEWGNPKAEGFGDVYFDASATNKLYKHSDNYENSDGTDKILRDIPNKASIVLTPTAYSDGSLNTVIPPYQVLPTELVTNGTFDTDSDWIKGTGWSIANGKASRTSQSGSTACDQNISITANKTYKIVYDLTITSGSFFVRLAGTTNVSGTSRTTSGTYTDYLTAATGNDKIRLVGENGSFVGSIDNVSVKEVQEADFDFSRGSSATRVNEKGLIEDVQILSGELVQNGDFEQIGSEIITNGDFSENGAVNNTSYARGWYSPDSNISITSNELVITNGASVGGRAYATDGVNSQSVVTSGKIYKLVYTVTENNDNATILYHTGGAYVTAPNTVGTHTIYYKAAGTIFILRNNIANTTIKIDNVSVKEVGQNWTFGDGWSIGDGKAVSDGSQISTSGLIQTNVFENANTYKLNFDLISNGEVLKFWVNGTQNIFSSILSDGSHQYYFTTTTSGSAYFEATSNFIGSIDNISVIEITDDTDIPRIDYTSGQGALLLEPQSTNLIPYSSDFSQWGTGIGSSIESNTQETLSPQGIYNATKITATTTDPYIFKIVNVTAVTHTASVYVKGVGNSVGKQARILFWYIGTATGSTTSIPFTLTSEWQRVDGSFTPTGAGTLAIRLDFPADTAEVGDAGYLYGFQCEPLSYATSYIPTNGSTVTRSADVANNSGNADLINSTEGVLYANYKIVNGVASYPGIQMTDDSLHNQVSFYTYNNTLQFYIKSNNVNTILSSISVSENVDYKFAISYSYAETSIFLNGEKKHSFLNADMPLGLKKITINHSGNVSKYKALAVFKEALTDAELQKLTS